MTIKALANQQTLLNKIAEGDQHAFATVYYHYYDNIYRYALYLLKSLSLAQEVVQEGFLRFWTKGIDIRYILNIESFLITVVRNRSLDMLRKIKLSERLNKQQLHEWTETHNETEEYILLNEGRKILEKAVARLPAQQRLVYQLCHQQRMRYEDVAKELGLSQEHGVGLRGYYSFTDVAGTLEGDKAGSLLIPGTNNSQCINVLGGQRIPYIPLLGAFGTVLNSPYK